MDFFTWTFSWLWWVFEIFLWVATVMILVMVIIDLFKDHKLSGVYKVYGYDTPNSTGAELGYAEGKAFNPVVPAAVIADLDKLKVSFADGSLALKPTKEDAKAGK